MSETGFALGLAIIEVFDDTTGYRVEVTGRVKTIFGGVAWRVNNRSETEVTVCVDNFSPASGKKEELIVPNFPWEGECTRPLQPNKTGWILAEFVGTSGVLYNYDVRVNSELAVDPQIEI